MTNEEILKLYEKNNAKRWVDQLCEAHPEFQKDHGLLLTWFSSAMMSAYDIGKYEKNLLSGRDTSLAVFAKEQGLV